MTVIILVVPVLASNITNALLVQLIEELKVHSFPLVACAIVQIPQMKMQMVSAVIAISITIITKQQ